MKIQINHTDIVFESRFSLEDMLKVAEYDASALDYFDEDGDPLFYIDPIEYSGDIHDALNRMGLGDYGIGFAYDSVITGKAVVYCDIPRSYFEKRKECALDVQENLDFLKKCVAEEYGTYVEYMNVIEDQIANALDKIKHSTESYVNKIEIPVLDSLPCDDKEYETAE